MPDSFIDPTAVRALARTLRSTVEECRAAGPVLHQLPELSARTPAGAAMAEFATVLARAAQILTESARMLASATGDAAGIWCTVDLAVAGR